MTQATTYRASRQPIQAALALIGLLLLITLLDPAGVTLSHVHVVLEVAATALALCAAALAAVRFRAQPRTSALLVATAFALAAALDGIHVIFSLGIRPPGTVAATAELMAWSWLASRFALGFVLWLAALGVGLDDALPRDDPRPEAAVAVIVAAAVIGSYVALTHLALPPLRSPYPDMPHPYELVPAILFALAAGQLALAGTFRRDPFDHGLLIALILSAVSQAVFAPFVREPFDARFDAAHVMKVASRLAVVMGGVGTLAHLYRRSDRFASRLQTEVATRERAESRIRLYEDVVHNMQIGLVVLRHGEADEPDDLTLVAANPAASLASGIDLEPHLGHRLREIVPGLAETGLPGILASVLRSGKPLALGELDYRPIGADRVLDLRLFPLPDRSLGVTFDDVTARREAIDATEAAVRQLAEAQAVAHMGSWVWDMAADRHAWSDEMFRLLGHEPGTVKAELALLVEHVHPDDRARLRDAIARAGEAGKGFREDVRIVRRDGRFRHLMVLGNVDRGSAGPAGRLWGTIQDVTDAREAEETLRGTARRLEASNRELESFAYVASHDLKEPLRKIIAFGERLSQRLEGRLDADEVDYLGRMTGAAERMQGLIADLLELSRVGSSREPLVEVDLDAILAGVLGDLEARIAATGAQVTVGTLPSLHADPTQMHQLFLNLVGNALKFSREGVTPAVTVRGTVLPRAGRIPQRVEIEVQDNGMGFETRYIDRIFEPFQRLHGRQAYEGTGMGLAICRRIVERHDGTITARGRPGEGATFVVTLPAEPPEETPT